jgi:hypothetical protein
VVLYFFAGKDFLKKARAYVVVARTYRTGRR